MQNENNHQHWKEKLDNADTLSAGIGVNEDALWTKLEQRLQQKPKRRKAVWYWAAAACLLPVFFLLSLPLFQNKRTVVKPVVHTNTIAKASLPKTEPAQREVVIAKPSIAVTKKTIVKQREKNVVDIDTNNERVITENIDSLLQDEPIASLVHYDSNIVKPTLIAQQKKKLPVVHINELNESVESTPVMAHNFYLRSFPLQIAREESYSHPLQLTNKVSFVSFTTKSPSN